MTQAAWLTSHPYLASVAEFDAQVATAAANIRSGDVNIPNWDDYIADYHAGVPLLGSSSVAIDFEPAGAVLISLVENLASTPLPEELADQCRDLHNQLRGEKNAPRLAAGLVTRTARFQPAHPGLLRYLGWTALARILRPLVDTFGSWRDEEHWLRGYCPTCGSRPAMAQLVGVDPGRLRLLSCGCCSTRWRYRRIGCPFCENPKIIGSPP